jgi:hypothetical protein
MPQPVTDQPFRFVSPPIPDLFRHFHERCSLPDPGVGHNQVQTAKPVKSMLDETVGLPQISNIGAHRSSFNPELSAGLNDVLSLTLLPGIINHHMSACLCQS